MSCTLTCWTKAVVFPLLSVTVQITAWEPPVPKPRG